MKMISALFLLSCATLGVLGAPETPSAPYAPSGWRPRGPSFDLPTRSLQEPQQQVPNAFAAPQEEVQEAAADIEVSEEEVQYTGEIGTTEATTPFLQYGPPITDLPEDEINPTTEAVEAEEELSVQGLPGVEPAKEFRALPNNERLRDRGVQRLRAQPKQKTARLQAQPSKQQAQFFQGQFQQQFQQQKQFQGQQVAYTTTNGFQPPIQQQIVSHQFGSKLQQQQSAKNAPRTQGFVAQQFGRFTAPQNLAPKQRLRPAPVFQQRFVQSQRQEQSLDTYGAPAQGAEIGGVPAQEYGPPAQEYGPPALVTPQETDIDQPEEVEPEEEPELPQVEEETTEVNGDFGEEEEVDGGEVAISNAVASGRYVLLQQTGRPAKLRSGRTPKAAKLRAQNNLRQITEPIFTYNQFGQLVRIF